MRLIVHAFLRSVTVAWAYSAVTGYETLNMQGSMFQLQPTLFNIPAETHLHKKISFVVMVIWSPPDACETAPQRIPGSEGKKMKACCVLRQTGPEKGSWSLPRSMVTDRYKSKGISRRPKNCQIILVPIQTQLSSRDLCYICISIDKGLECFGRQPCHNLKCKVWQVSFYFREYCSTK